MRTPSTGRNASWGNQRRAKSAQANCRRRILMFHKPAVWAVAPILATFLALGATAAAQELSTLKFEVGVNYSWFHVISANFDRQRTGNGGSMSVRDNFFQHPFPWPHRLDRTAHL